jgi:hypothetical protein
MAKKRKVGNLFALAVLSYLTQRPMHPYELGRTLRDHGDERSIKFNHGSLYMVVQQLERAGSSPNRKPAAKGSAQSAPCAPSPRPGGTNCTTGCASWSRSRSTNTRTSSPRSP